MKVLVVDDDLVTLQLLKEVLEENKFKVFTASKVDEAKESLQDFSPDIVLTDINIEDSADGFNLLEHIQRKYPKLVTILMTGFGSMSGAIEAIQKGAFDYISKPFNLDEMMLLIFKAAKQVDASRNEKSSVPSEKQTNRTRTLRGKSPKMIEVYRSIARSTVSSSSVLILGESGTGKELVARAIHENGPRKSGSFVAVNCGALTETLLESELFGYMKGAFTGANQDRTGLFLEANNGTLFLDEVGDIPLGLQVKLLRVLQENEIRPVGSNQTKKIDVRVIAATHRDLTKLVREGKFREDLYYRLKVIEIAVPPLRKRSEDIPELVQDFITRCALKGGKSGIQISKEAMDALSAYNWPGNVRELEHQIERAVALTSSSVLSADDFDLRTNDKSNAPTETKSLDSAGDGAIPSLEQLEKEHIEKVLKKVQGNKSKAAEILGIDRATLYRKAEKYGLIKEEKD